MEWGAIIVPILLSVVALVLYKHKLTWGEIIIPTIIGVIIIAICKGFMVSDLTHDTEYLTSYPTQVRYFEDWNEKVSCRHPEYCYRTETYRYSCGTSKSPRTCTGTRTVKYQCGWQHAYDVDYHPEYWDMVMNTGRTRSLSKSMYNYYIGWWKTLIKYKDMKRDYHTNDGDSYRADWSGNHEHVDPYVISHSYANKVQAVNSVFKFRELDSIESKGLQDYPPIVEFEQRSCIGCTDEENEHLERYNALYGLKNQVRAYIIVFDNPSEETAELQQVYWRGGNKNEIVVCVNKNNKWAKAFSWSDDKRLETELSYLFVDANTTRTQKIDKMYELIPSLWKRKNFSDFDYIKVPLSNKQLMWIYIIVFVSSIISLIIGVKNDINPL